MSSFDFIIIGSGNISYFLMKELLKAGGRCRALVGRNNEHLIQLSSKFDNNIEVFELESFLSLDNNLISDTKYVFLAVSDDAIQLLSERLKKTNACIIHCSGARPLTDVSEAHSRSAVLYPLQSILKDELQEDLEVPFLIEASNQSIEEELMALTGQMGYNATIMSSEKRLKLHLCAVWINNFVNYISSVALDILVKESLPESLIMPLMDRTLKRLKTISANEAQTGPAKRGDYQTINAHLDLLERDDQEVYKLLSNVINRKFNN